MFAKHSAVLTVVLVMLSAAFAQADWRAELRAKMNPTGDVRDVLDSRGVALDDWVGSHQVELTWSSGQLSLAVDSVAITDLEQWTVDDGSLVVVFSAYEGRGPLGPDGTAGLLGYIYLDDLDRLRVELEVDVEYIIYETDSDGDVGLERASTCRCRKFPVSAAGCVSTDCDNTHECPSSAGHYCEWTEAASTLFEGAFHTVADTP